MGILKYLTILCLCLNSIQEAQSSIFALIQQNSVLTLGQNTTFVCQGERDNSEDITLQWDIGSKASGSFVSTTNVNLIPYSYVIDSNINDDNRIKIGLNLPITNQANSSPLNVATVGLYIQCIVTDPTSGTTRQVDLEIGTPASSVLLQETCGTLQCTVANSYCPSGICVCRPGFYPQGNSACLSVKANGQSCNNNIECSSTRCVNQICQATSVLIQHTCTTDSCTVTNSYCPSGQCLCTTGFYAEGDSQCLLKKSNGASCSNNIECSSGSCVNNICVSTGALLSQTCSNTVLCSTTIANSGCSTGVCRCDTNYYQFSSTRCLAKKSNGASCSNNIECSSGSCVNNICVSTGALLSQTCSNTVLCSTTIANSGCSTGVCRCDTNYYQFSSTRCLAKKSNGASCSNNIECSSGSCVNNICVSTGALLSQTCSNTVLCSTTIANSGCSTGVCRCDTNYYQFSSTQCRAKAVYGATCSQTVSDSCRDSNAECPSGTCVCRSSYTLQGGVCTLQSSGSNQCPANTNSPQENSNGVNNPTVWVEATCYVIQASSTQVLPCVNTRTTDQVRAARWDIVRPGAPRTPVDPSTEGYINGQWDISNLTISNAKSINEGDFYCVLCFEVNFTRCTDSPRIQVIVDGDVITSSAIQVDSTTPLKGSDVVLTCVTTPTGAADSYQWKRDGLLLGENTSTFSFTSGTGDSGAYTCAATNPTTSSFVASSAVSLDVQYRPEFSGSDTRAISANLGTRV